MRISGPGVAELVGSLEGVTLPGVIDWDGVTCSVLVPNGVKTGCVGDARMGVLSVANGDVASVPPGVGSGVNPGVLVYVLSGVEVPPG